METILKISLTIGLIVFIVSVVLLFFTLKEEFKLRKQLNKLLNKTKIEN